MKVALIRGDFANPWELQNFEPLTNKIDLTLFTGYYPISSLDSIKIPTKHLLSPVDVNLGKISRNKMAILNRLFIDAHQLMGLENELKGYDIAHTAESYFGFTNQALKAKLNGNVKKVISTIWENIPYNNETIHGRKQYKQFAHKNTDLFLPVTEKGKQSLIMEGVNKDKIVVLRPGVDIKEFSPKRRTAFKDMRKFSNGEEKTIATFIGRLEPEKGVVNLVRQFGYKINKTNTHLIIVGSGSLEAQIRNLLTLGIYKNVHFFGQLNYKNIPELYNFSDFLIHPAFGNRTWEEQYGMVLVEAMASGIPIIGSNSGSIPEIIGNAGFIADEKSLFKLAYEFANNRDLINSYKIKARQRAVKEFNREIFARRLFEIYKKTLK